MDLIEFSGWFGSMCFMFSGLPQAYKSYKDKHSDGVSSGLLWLWMLGEIFSFIYVFPKAHIPLIVNYVCNAAFISIIIFYKLFGSNKVK